MSDDDDTMSESGCKMRAAQVAGALRLKLTIPYNHEKPHARFSLLEKHNTRTVVIELAAQALQPVNPTLPVNSPVFIAEKALAARL